MISDSHFELYCRYLNSLCNIPSVTLHPQNVLQLILFCKKIFEESLDHYTIFIDEKNNLVCLPESINPNRNLIYLSAHADTVDAVASEWTDPYHPFQAYEDAHEIVARGVSDCKAGVAFQLLVALLLKENAKLENIIFTITFKEEGSGEKTARAIGKKIGRDYPLSTKRNYLLVLENTVSLSNPKPILGYYTREKSNYVVQIEGSLEQLKQRLLHLQDWNPIAISPLNQSAKTTTLKTLSQKGGHVCTLGREQNLLTKAILESSSKQTITAGGANQIGVAPTSIQVETCEEEIPHVLILGNRCFMSSDQIRKQLEEIPHIPVTDFHLGSGMDIKELFHSDPISTLLKNLGNQFLCLEEDSNPGQSDASIIYQAIDLPFRHQLLPIVIGPGTRSQKQAIPPRLTHGVNETFNKIAGKQAIQTLVELLKRVVKGD